MSVRDFGPGLEPAELKRVWEPFYQVGGASAQTATGAGLGFGLYIAREVIRGHGGRVGVTSKRTEGAMVWFTMPLVRSPS